MFDTLSIRLKIVLLSGLCLLGVIALVVGMNIYNTAQNNALVSDSSSRMLTASVQQLLQAKAAEQAVQLQRTFGDSLVALTPRRPGQRPAYPGRQALPRTGRAA